MTAKMIVAISTLLAFQAAGAQVFSASAVQKTLSGPVKARLDGYTPQALSGNYQAMRNVAYVWAVEGSQENPRAAVVGCAWYHQIMIRHAGKVHAGDAGNREVYCNRLNAEDVQSALGLSSRIGWMIEKRDPRARFQTVESTY